MAATARTARTGATWVERALSLPGLSLVPLEPEIAITSTRLPGPIHGDPADRILAATAFTRGLTLVTRDRNFIAYARHGFLRVLAA